MHLHHQPQVFCLSVMTLGLTLTLALHFLHPLPGLLPFSLPEPLILHISVQMPPPQGRAT